MSCSPQYPLYSAALALHGAHLAPYYLDEEQGWGLTIPHLREQMQKVRPRNQAPQATSLLQDGTARGHIALAAIFSRRVSAFRHEILLISHRCWSPHPVTEFNGINVCMPLAGKG